MTVASDTTALNLEALPQTFVYNPDTSLQYIQVVAPQGTYRQTFTYSSGLVTAITAWTKQ